MKIKAIMLGLAVSGALLFGKEAEFRIPKIKEYKNEHGTTQFKTDIDPQKEIEKLDPRLFDLTNRENAKTLFEFVVLAHQNALTLHNRQIQDERSMELFRSGC